MPRALRNDREGRLYHVTNRGIARRTVFDTAADYRFFLTSLACAVRRKEISLLAFALMQTHFHLFILSHGGMSVAMKRTQARQTRRFNRLRGRDGPLMRSRFYSKPVDSLRYRRVARHYIHENPVLAGLCQSPEEYRWSSAWYEARGQWPRWLSIQSLGQFGIAPYAKGPGDPAAMRARADLMDAQGRAPAPAGGSSLDVRTPETVLAWMRRRAELADGVHSEVPAIGPMTLLAMVDDLLPLAGETPTQVPGAGAYSTRELLLTGLLRSVSCCSFPRIAGLLHCNVSRTTRLSRLHHRCVAQLPAYAAMAAHVVHACAALIDDADDADEDEPGTDQPIR